MSRSTAVRCSAALTFFCVAIALTLPLELAAAEPAPQVSKDGLELRKQTRQRLVYVKPGATFTQYTRIAILDPYIEFSQTWLRDYNNSVRDTSRRIRDSDLERAKQTLTEQFKRIFTEELTKGGYQVTDSGGPDVLVLRPALVNIRVNAPDLMTPGRSVTYAQSAGEMTLYLELWDSATNKILARVVDAQSDSSALTQRANTVTNQAAANRILSDWAKELREKLDLARGKSG